MKKIILSLLALGILSTQGLAETKILKEEPIDLGEDKYILYTICKDDLVYSMYKHLQTGNLVVNQEFFGYGAVYPKRCKDMK